MGLFLKEGSSKSSKSDAPLRNSDRRKLRQAVEKKLLWVQSSSTDDDDDDDETAAASNNNIVRNLLDDIFLDSTSNILVRKVKLPKNKNNSIVHPTVIIYFRTPSNRGKSNNKNDNNQKTPFFGWPYHSSMNHNIGTNTNSNSNNGNVPILMEVEDGDKQKYLVPTIALLSVLPISRITTMTVPAAVSKYICRGADLMRSGVMNITLPSFGQQQQQQPLAQICVHDNPQPFAIGFITRDTNIQTVGPSSKGIAVQILTYYGDDISRPYAPYPKDDQPIYMSLLGGGATYGDGNYGNVGFEDGSYVYSLKQQIEEDDESQYQNIDANNNTTDSNANNDAHQNSDNGIEQMKQLSDCANDMNGKLGQLNIDENESTNEVNIENVKNPSNNQETSSSQLEETAKGVEEMSQDEILLQAFHNALLLVSPKKDLPMPVSTFYSKYVLPSRPADTTIHIKQTSFQKFGAFLLFQQNSSQIVKTKGNAQDAVAMLVDINRNHVDLKDAKLRRKKNPAAQANLDSSSSSKKRLATVNLHLIPPKVATLMRLDDDIVKAVHAKSDFRKNTGFLTAPECRNILETYLTEENLVSIDDPEYAILDGALTDIIYSKKNRQKVSNTAGNDGNNNNDIPSKMTRKSMHTEWMKCLEKGYAFVEMPGSKILTMKRGSPPLINIEVEARQKRKSITRLTGLEEYFIDPTTFANDVAKRFACAATVEEKAKSTTKKHCMELEFQGHLVEELTALLLGNDKMSSHGGVKDSPYSVPKGVISVKCRKGRSNKKPK